MLVIDTDAQAPATRLLGAEPAVGMLDAIAVGEGLEAFAVKSPAVDGVELVARGPELTRTERALSREPGG